MQAKNSFANAPHPATKGVDSAELRIGIDIGGTFTDLVAMSGGRVVCVDKVLTTPQDPAVAVAQGLDRLLRQLDGAAVREVVHGTTLVPNALIERKGAVTGLITTLGFRDALAIGREHRYDIYDLGLELPEPLVPRRRRWEVRERILADGSVDEQLDSGMLEEIAARVARDGVESLAICFLHSYRNADHERQAAGLLREMLPSVPISLSSEVVPEIGEYGRVSTTVANAYVRPLIDGYLDRVRRIVSERGIEAPLHVMLSTGGLADLDFVRKYPVRLTESGPAAGVISAAHSARLAGSDDVLAFDMGGTTAKACVVEDGDPRIAAEHEVARLKRFVKGSGLPIRMPVVDLIEIGAGGGSIAAIDGLGLVKVGPESASADPGPACYGRGGRRPTVTDADLVLGYLSSESFLGGAMELDEEAARAALGELAGPLGVDPVEAAAAVYRVVNENMAAAARIHAIERGRNVADLDLVATGGAGPVHAWGLARRLGVARIVYPPAAGVASSFGLLVAAPVFEFAKSMPSPMEDLSFPAVRSVLDEMVSRGVDALSGLGLDPGDVETSVAADMRFRGQGGVLTVDLGSALPSDQEAPQQVLSAFERQYIAAFGRLPEGMGVDVVTWRVSVRAPHVVRSGATVSAVSRNGRPESAHKGKREIWSEDKEAMVEADVYERYALMPGTRLNGPAVLEERESTVVIAGEGAISVDDNLNLVVDVDD